MDMAQHYSVPGHYPPQDVQHPTPSTGCRQIYHSPMSPPPYPGDYQGYISMPFEPKMDYNARTSTQYTHTYPEASHQSHHLPIVIPQTAPGGNNPFTRACSPVLSTHNIALSTFLTFLDTLNVCLANTPPLQILDLAGGFVGMVPHHIPALIGTSLQATAKVAGAITSKTRVAKLLNSANEEIFAPQGLKVELVDTETLKRKLGIERGRPLLGGLDERGLEMSVRDRRLHALEAYIAPLEFDVPEPARQENAIDRLSASQLKRQMAKAEEKAIEARKKETEKKNKKAEKEDRKAGKDKKRGKERKEKKEKDDKESKAAEKLLWLYIGQL